jgi:hypothetical protein
MDPDFSTLLEEEPVAPLASRESFPELVARLSALSVTKHYDAYADVPWDAPSSRIDVEDPIWQLGTDHPLGASDWYAEQPPALRARIGLHFIVCAMQTGSEFENVLTRGLLTFAMALPAGAPEYRYVYHEAIEESQHTLMFHEFVSRCGLDPGDPGLLVRLGRGPVIRLARRFPALFFLFVLGGEDPIDYVQRLLLRSGRPVHPLLKRIMQIHITEEARHLCFARAYLHVRVPTLRPLRRRALAIAAPLVLGSMARRMLDPPPAVVRTYQIPRAVVAKSYRGSPLQRQRVRDSLGKVRTLCEQLDLLTPAARRIWRRLGIA